MTLGEKILKYRKQAGLSQEELADKMYVTRQSISLWETDQTTPTLDNLIMLAEIFAVSLDELCGTSVKDNTTQQSQNVSNADSPQNAKIRTLLLTMFILSLLSIIMALITVAICIQFSPLPDFPYTFPEYMWIFYLFIPLPLVSAVLGIVFYTKKYRCKKNMIAGFIMCALLLIYGSFTFIYKDYALHDFGYVRELEQTVSIDLPDRGYISRAKNTDSKTNSVAMIKFDDADGIYNIVSSDGRFSIGTDSIPFNLIDAYYSAVTSDYHYFMLSDITDNEADGATNTEQRRYIFLAYNTDKNILFVLDFVK